eukprot:TRINITY_DN4629_c0_g1_i1.p1 TRINITY_DN4629_c0_g1~~TRINITY_DN4629_c0_g1_i1.p1  ORF type:complete len:272 (+),score=29.66 TRINITY_DN4629_c0_g1_i1:133-948(+)
MKRAAVDAMDTCRACSMLRLRRVAPQPSEQQRAMAVHRCTAADTNSSAAVSPAVCCACAQHAKCDVQSVRSCAMLCAAAAAAAAAPAAVPRVPEALRDRATLSCRCLARRGLQHTRASFSLGHLQQSRLVLACACDAAAARSARAAASPTTLRAVARHMRRQFLGQRHAARALQLCPGMMCVAPMFCRRLAASGHCHHGSDVQRTPPKRLTAVPRASVHPGTACFHSSMVSSHCRARHHREGATVRTTETADVWRAGRRASPVTRQAPRAT